MKYGVNIFYCYLTIIVINLIINIIFLGLGVVNLETLISNTTISNNGIISSNNDQIYNCIIIELLKATKEWRYLHYIITGHYYIQVYNIVI
jgi:hypothetical protein